MRLGVGSLPGTIPVQPGAAVPPPLLPADGVGRARKRQHDLFEVMLATGDLADHEYAALVLT